MKTTADPSTQGKLREVRPLDQDYLLIYAKDGEVSYRDDGTGPSAFQGHDFSSGDDCLIRHGAPLDVTRLQDLSLWRLTSLDDPAYGEAGLRPEAVYRKAKPCNATYAWEYALDHWLYLKWPSPLRQGATYQLTLSPALDLGRTETVFTFDAFSNLSEAIHVNILGYEPESVAKPADLYSWLGDGGARDYRDFVGLPYYLVDVVSGERHRVGTVQYGHDHARELEGRSLTGSPVWSLDFDAFSRPGEYRLAVPGIGCSQPFRLERGIFREPFRYALLGYYYMRIGEAKTARVPVPRQPRFIPAVDPPGFKIYLTDVHPYTPVFQDYPADTWDEPHHLDNVEDSLFWKRRLPGHPTNDRAVGGHADAFDWDRHLGHVSNAYDLILSYLLAPAALGHDDVGIPESGDGIPDLLNEAQNEVDLFLSLRDGEAYSHGLTNPCKQLRVMFQAGTTTVAAWANAANCAMLADAFRVSGHAQLHAYYVTEAQTAFAFATRQADPQLDLAQDVGDAIMRGRDFRTMAAAYLFNATGDPRWEDILAEAGLLEGEETEIERVMEYTHIWTAAAYLLCPHERRYPELALSLAQAVRREAMETGVQQIAHRPSRRASPYYRWQTPHNLHRIILAHRISTNPAERATYERAMVLETSWGLGRNPLNLVQMTGLGARHIVNCFTTGRNDGTPGLHPGQTPYLNIDPWSFDHHGGNPGWLTSKCYPAWDDDWPLPEAHFDNRYCWSNSEFTPQQTMRGKMLAYAYLLALSPQKPREPDWLPAAAIPTPQSASPANPSLV